MKKEKKIELIQFVTGSSEDINLNGIKQKELRKDIIVTKDNYVMISGTIKGAELETIILFTKNKNEREEQYREIKSTMADEEGYYEFIMLGDLTKDYRVCVKRKEKQNTEMKCLMCPCCGAKLNVDISVKKEPESGGNNNKRMTPQKRCRCFNMMPRRPF